jgi:hypothetical protein
MQRGHQSSNLQQSIHSSMKRPGLVRFGAGWHDPGPESPFDNSCATTSISSSSDKREPGLDPEDPGLN